MKGIFPSSFPDIPVTKSPSVDKGGTSPIPEASSEEGQLQPTQICEQDISGPQTRWLLLSSGDLRSLNRFIRKHHFKMDGTVMLRDLLQVSDWMCSINLKDAYLSVNIVQGHQQYLRFTWRGTTYKFTCLPFGLSSAPRAFTNLRWPS